MRGFHQPPSTFYPILHFSLTTIAPYYVQYACRPEGTYLVHLNSPQQEQPNHCNTMLSLWSRKL